MQAVSSTVFPEPLRARLDVSSDLRRYVELLLEAMWILRDFEHQADRMPDGAAEVPLAARALARELVPRFRDIRARANELVHGWDPSSPEGAAAKRLTEMTVTPALQRNELFHRAYVKPRGYAGDYICMELAYDAYSPGPSVYSHLLHQLLLDYPMWQCVMQRKDRIRRVLAESIAAAAPGRPVRALSVACGPAREIREVVAELDLDVKLEVVLLDRDTAALAHASAIIACAGQLRGTRGVSTQQIGKSAFALLKESERARLGRFDLIYSTGLFDYLPDPAAQSLGRALGAMLAPGGRLVVGNMLERRDVLWLHEYCVDWSLRYRSERDLQRILASPEVQHVHTWTDTNNVVAMTEMRSIADA